MQKAPRRSASVTMGCRGGCCPSSAYKRHHKGYGSCWWVCESRGYFSLQLADAWQQPGGCFSHGVHVGVPQLSQTSQHFLRFMTEMEKLIINGEDFFPASAQVPERAGAPHHFGKGVGKSAPLSSRSVLVFSALAVPKLHRGVRVVPLVCAAGRVSVGASCPVCLSIPNTRETTSCHLSVRAPG